MAYRTRDRKRSKCSKDWAPTVNRILDVYIEAAFYPPIGAVQIDPEKKPRTNPFLMAEFKADCDLTFSAALKDHHYLQNVLKSVLKEMSDQESEPVTAGDRVALTQRLGPELAKRGLSPWTYFTRHKRERHDRQN